MTNQGTEQTAVDETENGGERATHTAEGRATGEPTASSERDDESATPIERDDESTASIEASGDAALADGRAVLSATDVAVSYGSVDVLDDVSIDVRAGQVTALIGPNGTGKTSLLGTLVGLREPTAGRVEYHGPAVAREIGYLPQQPAFRPGFTVRETLAFYSSLVGGGDEDAMERLEWVGLDAAADRDVEALSGGMTRLAGIAQATVGDPPVVALDEPASGLDPGMRSRVFEIASEIAEGGAGVVVTSHDLELVERTADVVYLLDDGTVAERGSPAALAERLDVDSLRAVYETAVTGDLHRVAVRGESA